MAKKPRKKDTQHIHALRRAEERYGAKLSQRDLAEMRNKIKTGYSKFVGRLSHRVSEHLVDHNGQSYRVAYDNSRSQICSFLPLEKEDAT